MCACYVLNIIALEFLWVGESPSGTVSCFPTADADEKQSTWNSVSLGWYFHRYIPPRPSNRQFACLHLCLSMRCKCGLPPPKKVGGSWVKDETESEGHRVCGPGLRSSLQCSRRSSLNLFACVHCCPRTTRGMGLSKIHVHVWEVVFQTLPSGALPQKTFTFKDYNSLVVLFF